GAFFVGLGWLASRRQHGLHDPNPAVRVAAIRACYRSDPDAVINALQDPDSDVRLVAAMHLGWADPLPAQSAQALVAALKDKHAGVRREVAEALGALGPRATETLAAALRDDHPWARAGAALALSNPG